MQGPQSSYWPQIGVAMDQKLLFLVFQGEICSREERKAHFLSLPQILPRMQSRATQSWLDDLTD